MKALVYHGLGQPAWEEMPEPQIEQPTDVVVRACRSAPERATQHSPLPL